MSRQEINMDFDELIYIHSQQYTFKEGHRIKKFNSPKNQHQIIFLQPKILQDIDIPFDDKKRIKYVRFME
ncbi:hypothetical protein pb186bvf_013312 [Paramecium bursaria]